MNRKVSVGVLITLLAVVAAATFSITMVFSMQIFNDKVYNIKEREAMYSKLSEVDKLYRSNYIGSIDDKNLMNALVAGYVQGSGDEYARYYTAEEYEREMQSTSGKTVGIGIVAEQDLSGYLRITEVYDDSPASQSGLTVGDLIVQVEELEIKAENIDEAKLLIRGEAGTKLNLTIRRDNEDTEMELTRRIVDIPSVYSRMIDRTAYIRISEFTDTTDEQFEKHLSRQISSGAEGVILDLRFNEGGILDSAIRVIDRLVPQGPICSATYKNGTTEVLATSDSKELTLPIVVLTNEKTSSEAELVAQVLKDYGKAKTVGTKTFGKGVVQDTIRLSDSSAILMTTAVLNPPKSQTFNGVGVSADYEVKSTAEQDKEFPNLNEYNDTQLQKALEVVQASTRAENAGEDGSQSSQESSESSQSSSQGEGESQSSSSEDEE